MKQYLQLGLRQLFHVAAAVTPWLAAESTPSRARLPGLKLCIKVIGIMAVLTNLLGCATMQDSSEVTQQQEDMLLLKEDLNRTKGKLESLEMEYQRLLHELDAMQGVAASSKGATSSTQARIDDLERRLSMLEGARTKDRQAIVDQLSGKMADIMGDKTTAKSSSKNKAAASKAGAGAAGMNGYEHVVKEGETLSAIASAYKVKTSAIIEANKLQSPYTLKTGLKLFIPQP